ncbi:hypothetical protein TNCV_520231 [Trichonephila clavipes]|nr:hypothetical protein TNCV_520231 [Trichonephila clavipes]
MRSCVIGYEKVDFLSAILQEKLTPNVSTAHDCRERWSRIGTPLKGTGSVRVPSITDREDHRIRRTAKMHRTESVAAVLCSTEHQQTERYWFLQRLSRARRPVVCDSLNRNITV